MQPEPENVVPSEFDPVEFWDLHKNKIILYGLLLVAGLAAFVIYQISTHRGLVESEAMFQEASSIEDYQLLMKEYPRSVAAADAHLIVAQKLREEGKYEQALDLLRQLVGQFPEHPLVAGAWLSIGQTEQASGDLDSAIATYQQVVAKYPSSYAAPFAQFNYAGILRAQGKTGEARLAYETVISQFPESYLVRQAQQELRFLEEQKTADVANGQPAE